MRKTLLATSTIATLALGSATAFAQGQTSGGSGAAGSPAQAGSSSAAMPKPMSQAQVQQTMKDAGFTGVQILDAAYLVQATTKDGNQILVLVNAPMLNRDGGNAGASRTSGAAGGNPQLLVKQVDHTRSMEELLSAAQKLRESIQALAQQPPGAKRSAAIESARDALLLTQRAMLQLPAEMRVEGGQVHEATAWPKSMARLDEAARSLRESVQAMSTQAAGDKRTAAMATALKALRETEQAMLALPDYEGPK